MSNVYVSSPKTCSIMHGVVSSQAGVETTKKGTLAKYFMDVHGPLGSRRRCALLPDFRSKGRGLQTHPLRELSV